MSYIPAAKMPHAAAPPVPPAAEPAPAAGAASIRRSQLWLAFAAVVAGAGVALLAGSTRR